jgi:hypothetical protein
LFFINIKNSVRQKRGVTSLTHQIHGNTAHTTCLLIPTQEEAAGGGEEEGDDDQLFQLFLVEDRLTVAHRPNSQERGQLLPLLQHGDLLLLE